MKIDDYNSDCLAALDAHNGMVTFHKFMCMFLFYRVLIRMHPLIKIKILCSRSSATRGIVSVHDYVKPRRYIW